MSRIPRTFYIQNSLNPIYRTTSDWSPSKSICSTLHTPKTLSNWNHSKAYSPLQVATTLKKILILNLRHMLQLWTLGCPNTDPNISKKDFSNRSTNDEIQYGASRGKGLKFVFLFSLKSNEVDAWSVSISAKRSINL